MRKIAGIALSLGVGYTVLYFVTAFALYVRNIASNMHTTEFVGVVTCLVITYLVIGVGMSIIVSNLLRRRGVEQTYQLNPPEIPEP